MCSPLNAVSEIWGQTVSFTGLTFTATQTHPETQAETAAAGVVLVTGYARHPQGGIDTSKIVVAVRDAMLAPAVLEAPIGNSWTRLWAASFSRGGQALILLMQEIMDGHPTSISRRRVLFQIMPTTNGTPVVADQSANFDLTGQDVTAQVMVAPSPSGKLIFVRRGIPQQHATTEHILWRTDNGKTVMAWNGVEDEGTPSAPRPFRVAKVDAQSRLFSMWKSSADDNIQSATMFASQGFPSAQLAFTPQTREVIATSTGGGAPTAATGVVELVNSGNDAVDITSLSITSGITLVTPPATPFCLDAGATRALTVRFAPPNTTTTADATLTASGGGMTATARIRGRISTTGVPQQRASFDVTPHSLAFPPEQVVTQEFTITNNGNQPIEVQVPRGGQYGIDWPALAWTPLQPGQWVKHPVTHYATEGDRVSASVRVEARWSGGPLSSQYVGALANVTGLAAGSVRILHIEANPPGNDVAGEYIVLFNTTGTELDLQGVSIEHMIRSPNGQRRRAEFFRFTHSTKLPPFHFTFPLPAAQVKTGSGVDQGLLFHAGRNQAIWNNTGDEAQIWGDGVDGTRILLDRATYGSGQFYSAFGSGAVPYTSPPAASDPPSIDTTLQVPESADWVDTNIDLFVDDRVDFRGSGEIWAGVWFTGNNGPDGWEGWLQTGQQWPYNNQPDSNSFCLIGRIGPDGGEVFRIGSRLTKVIGVEGPARLFVRVNDDAPGNGSGAFTCRIVVRS